MKFFEHLANIYRVSSENKAGDISIAFNMFTNNIRDSVEKTSGEDKYFYPGAVGADYPALYPELKELEGEINAFRSWNSFHFVELGKYSKAKDYDGMAAYAALNPEIPFHAFTYPEGVQGLTKNYPPVEE